MKNIITTCLLILFSGVLYPLPQQSSSLRTDRTLTCPNRLQHHLYGQATVPVPTGAGDTVLDYYLYYYYDSEREYWQDYYRYTPEYDDEYEWLSILIEEKDITSGLWSDYYLYTYSYDVSGNLIEVLMQERINNVWQNDFLERLSYDGNNNLTSYLFQEWIDNGWTDSLKIDYFYEQDRLVREEWLYYNEVLNTPQYRALYEYNEKGKVALETWELIYENVWYPYTKGEYEYNADTLLVKERWYDIVEFDWQETLLFNYSYFGKKLTGIIGFIRSETGDVWLNNVKHNYQYDNNGELAEYKYQEWSDEPNNWEDVYKYTYHYRIITGIDGEEDSFSVSPSSLNVIKVYPNPLISEAYVTISNNRVNDVIHPVEIVLYDIKGRKVQTVRSTATETADKWKITLNSVNSNGIYFLKVKTDNSVYVSKVLVINRE